MVHMCSPTLSPCVDFLWCIAGSLLLSLYVHRGGLAHLPIGNARPLCTTGAFHILWLTTMVPTCLRDNCPFTFPPPTLPPPPWQSSHSRSVHPPKQLRQLKLPAWGRGYDQCKQSTHYLHHKNRVNLPQYTPSFTIPSALIHGDLWRSFIVLDRGDI